MTYKDKTFCRFGDENNEKCRECDRYFDREKYRKHCEQRGFDMPIAWFVEKPCEMRNEKGKDNE